MTWAGTVCAAPITTTAIATPVAAKAAARAGFAILARRTAITLALPITLRATVTLMPAMVGGPTITLRCRTALTLSGGWALRTRFALFAVERIVHRPARGGGAAAIGHALVVQMLIA